MTVQDPEWNIAHPSTVSNILSNSTRKFSVSFTPSSNVTAVHQFNVSVTSEGDASRSSSVFVNIDVSQYYDIVLEMPLSERYSLELHYSIQLE